MGILWSRFFGKEEMKLVILGLDNAGKSTNFVQNYNGRSRFNCTDSGGQSGSHIYIYISIEFNLPCVSKEGILTTSGYLNLLSELELFEYKNLKFTSWSSYYGQAKALIMVVDSTDRSRLNLAKEELHRVATDPELSAQAGCDGACLLIFANKQDVKGCMSPAQVSEGLALTELRDRQWQIVACSALTGKGLMEGMDWIALTKI
ncbi:hypothetical protein PSHT_09089 [Puccinia striiformis]|uniref:Uncharacterized protein n=1 Tax=Puccinia striiformis TaxID=27350 RepID=A0A2S4VJJ6_9BASI|nr:hypothetical protein PSHT_09089 [Puccinia striiformis]